MSGTGNVHLAVTTKVPQVQEFIDQVLVGTLDATRVSVGENFRFGHRAAGDPGLLEADGRFETRVVPLVEVDGAVPADVLSKVQTLPQVKQAKALVF